MEFSAPETQLSRILGIGRVERWSIYSRLQQLAIPCQCSHGQPLLVNVATAAAAVQVWSVIQQCTAPRLTLADRLERCWQAPPYPPRLLHRENRGGESPR